MDNIDGLITKDDVYRLLSDFRIYIPADIRHQMVEKVKALPSVNVRLGDWISVKDRMPEERDLLYLVLIDEYRYSLMRYGRDNGEWVWYGDDIAWREQITHWMPLPEPIKEE